MNKAISVNSSTPQVVDMRGASRQFSVNLVVPDLSTAVVHVSNTQSAVENPSAAHWVEWPLGIVAIDIGYDFFSRVVAVRITRVSGSGVITGEVFS